MMTWDSSRAFVYLILLITWTNCSLLSRFRYPNEYAAPPEGILLPEDLPDDIYENLIDERPELEPILGPSRNTKVQHPKISKTTVPPSKSAVYHEFEYPRVYNEEEDDYEQEDEDLAGSTMRYTDHQKLARISTTSTAAAHSSRRLPFLTRNQTHNDSRRSMENIPIEERENPPWDSSPIIATCYTCGHTLTRVPRNSLCHDVFDSEDWTARTMKRFFRSTCHFNMKWARVGVTKKHTYLWYKREFTSSSLKTSRLGGYLPGCFKRFLDIGTIYTARGCRQWWPGWQFSSGSAASRFMRLEHLLRRYTDQCITSSHASLTPFSRGISLFARYHVCVCPGRYCNRATATKACHISLLFLSLIFIASFNFMNNVH